jgi:hypothetical protein
MTSFGRLLISKGEALVMSLFFVWTFGSRGLQWDSLYRMP